MRKILATLCLLGLGVVFSEGCARPAAKICRLRAKTRRRALGRFRKPPPNRRRMGTDLVPRPAFAHDSIPYARRPRSLIESARTASRVRASDSGRDMKQESNPGRRAERDRGFDRFHVMG